MTTEMSTRRKTVLTAEARRSLATVVATRTENRCVREETEESEKTMKPKAYPAAPRQAKTHKIWPGAVNRRVQEIVERMRDIVYGIDLDPYSGEDYDAVYGDLEYEASGLLRKVVAKLFGDVQENARARIVADVLTRMQLDDFLRHPAMYMREWQKQRGRTQELRLPEDYSSAVICHIVPACDTTR